MYLLKIHSEGFDIIYLLEVVLLSYDCHKKLPQIGWLKTTKFILSQFRRL